MYIYFIITSLSNCDKQHIYSYLEIISISEEVVVSISSPDVCPLVCSDSTFTMSERLVRNKGEDKLFKITEQQLILVFLHACIFDLSRTDQRFTEILSGSQSYHSSVEIEWFGPNIEASGSLKIL